MQAWQSEHPYLTPVNVALALVSAAAWVILEILGDTTSASFMLAHGAMHPLSVLYWGQWYRLLTAAFLHFGLQHLLNNLVLLICLGSYLERYFGKVRFVIFYLLTGVGGNVLSLWYMVRTEEYAVSAGASGVVFGMMGGLLILVLIHRGRFENLTLVRFLMMLALSLYYGVSTTGVNNVAHLGGLVVGMVLSALFFLTKKIGEGSRR